MDISVIIPVFNAATFLPKAVKSANNISSVREIILIEDGSTDNSLFVSKKLADEFPKVKLLTHPGNNNLGAGASRNLGIKNASNGFIAFLDADDYYLPDRFNNDIDVFSKNQDAEGVFNAIGTHFYSEVAKILYNKNFPGELTTVRYTCTPEKVFEGLTLLAKGFGYFHLDGLTVKRSAIERMDYCFNENLRLHQDTEFIIRLSYYSRFYPGKIDEPVGMRGVHDENRIIKLKNNNREAAANQRKHWSELWQWGKKAGLPDKYAQHLKCMHLSRSIPSYPKGIAWLVFFSSLITTRDILLKETYYKYFHSYLWGQGMLANLFLRMKEKFQLMFRLPLDI